MPLLGVQRLSINLSLTLGTDLTVLSFSFLIGQIGVMVGLIKVVWVSGGNLQLVPGYSDLRNHCRLLLSTCLFCSSECEALSLPT